MKDVGYKLFDLAERYARDGDQFALFDNGGHQHGFQQMAGLGCLDAIEIEGIEDLAGMDRFVEKHKGHWIFAHFTYELKDLFEPGLSSREEKVFRWPLASLFVPGQVLLHVNGEIITIDQSTPYYPTLPQTSSGSTPANHLQEQQVDNQRDSYLKAIDKVKAHLQRGDVYELNYCLPFGGTGFLSDPASTWWRMQSLQQAPFSCLYRLRNNWLLCSSPERFLKKTGNRLLSQPIKGTIRRGRNSEEDEVLRNALLGSEKERAENVMIVDLVRNDLGRIARTGTVKVEELFGIYPFPNVHQMISTISAEIAPDLTLSALLKATFPMGSMTGAPKIRAMEIIEETELFRRGIYSGSVGYITPGGDFDFNVVIRSILYDELHGQLRYPAGSAITSGCEPMMEWKECLLKAEGMQRVL